MPRSGKWMETGENRGNVKGRLILCSFAWAECPEKNLVDDWVAQNANEGLFSTLRLFDFSTRMDQYQNEAPCKKNHLQPWSVHKTGPKAFTHFAGVCSNHSSLWHRRYLGFAAGEMERLAGMVKVRADKYLQWLKSPWKRVYELWAYDFQ